MDVIGILHEVRRLVLDVVNGGAVRLRPVGLDLRLGGGADYVVYNRDVAAGGELVLLVGEVRGDFGLRSVDGEIRLVLDVVVLRVVGLVPVGLDVGLGPAFNPPELALVAVGEVVVGVDVVRVLHQVLGFVLDVVVGCRVGLRPVGLHVGFRAALHASELVLLRVGEVVVGMHVVGILDKVGRLVLDVVNGGTVGLCPVRLHLRFRGGGNHVVRVDGDVVAGSELVLLALEAPVEFGARGENRQVRLIPDI